MKNQILLLFTLFCGFDNYAQQLAFPTAEGYGKYTKGGRGGVVYEVTNLNDSGPGSLRAAVEASGPRTVVFRVSGTITLNKALDIRNPYITIAGQTAPGDGITIRKYPIVVRTDEVIIRYIRVRLGSESGRDDDAMGGRYFKNIIIDHVSTSWSVDEVMSFYHCENITVQWCILSEALVDAGHASGPHGFGGIAGSNYGTYHHNLFAHNSSRTPRMSSGSGYFDFRNNVIYNWGYQNIYGAENQQVGDPVRNFSVINLVANYYKLGPATVSGNMRSQIARPSRRDVPTDYGKWYIADNVMIGNATVTADNWLGVNPDGGKGDIPLLKLNDPWPSMPINQQTADEAYLSVLAHAGCSFPKRDVVDNRIIQETFEGVATYEGTYYKIKWAPRLADPTKMSGMIDNPADVGGWPTLNSTTPPADTDKDGMPDEWEIAKGLDPNNPADRNNIGAGGYTMLEIYINSLVNNVEPVAVNGVTVEPSNTELGIGESLQLISTVSPANATNDYIIWSTDNANIAMVSTSGIVTGIGKGSALITATTQDGGFIATCAVDVTDIALATYRTKTPGVLVYPVPFTNDIVVSYKGISNVNRMEVINEYGQVIKVFNNADMTDDSYKFNLNIPGKLFFIRIITNGKVFTEKIIRK